MCPPLVVVFHTLLGKRKEKVQGKVSTVGAYSLVVK